MVEARGYGSTKGALEHLFYERIYLYRSKGWNRKLCCVPYGMKGFISLILEVCGGQIQYGKNRSSMQGPGYIYQGLKIWRLALLGIMDLGVELK